MNKLSLLREADEELAQAINNQNSAEHAIVDREGAEKISLLEDAASVHAKRAQELIEEYFKLTR